MSNPATPDEMADVARKAHPAILSVVPVSQRRGVGTLDLVVTFRGDWVGATTGALAAAMSAVREVQPAILHVVAIEAKS